MSNELKLFLFLGLIGVGLIVMISVIGKNYNLNKIKSKTVGDGQHGTARFAHQKKLKRHIKE